MVLPLLLSACDTQFEPFADGESHFTILGYLDTDADTQFVRIEPLRPVIQRTGAPIDATVRTIDLTSQTVDVWTDSLIQFSDASFGHVYWSEFQAVPTHTYRIEVERSDGALAWAETTVPERPGDPSAVYGALNENASYAPLFFPGVTEVVDADVLYDVTVDTFCFVPPPSTVRVVHRIRYGDDARGVRWGANEWRFDLDLWRDRDVLVELSGLSGETCGTVDGLWVRLATPSNEFLPPGGVWDREVLIQPGAFSNVEGGFGFFASVARQTVKWTLSRNALAPVYGY
jgi:hypothetical protein